MLTIIFGAGASYDSNPEIPAANDTGFQDYNENNRLPLAKSLFSTRFNNEAANYNPGHALFPRLRRSAPNIEGELEKILNESSDYPKTKKQLLSLRYYLREVITNAQGRWNRDISGITTYKELLNIIDHWQLKTREEINLITFNYDTLLDEACRTELGMDLTKTESYVKNETMYKLFKVHGSIDWNRKVTNVAGEPINSTEHMIYTEDYFTINEQFPGGDFIKAIPAIAMPTQTKSAFEFPELHLNGMKEAINKTNLLLIIGWRGAENHFLELWKNHDHSNLKKLQIVSGDMQGALETEGNLNEAGVYAQTTSHSFEGFSKFVADELENFLNT